MLERLRVWGGGGLRLAIGLGSATLLAALLANAETPSLREAAQGHFLVGCPVGVIDLENQPLLDLIVEHFNIVTVETELMTFKLGADRDALAFEQADRVVAWAEQQRLPILGHMLLWDYRVPGWLFEDRKGDPLPRDDGLKNLRSYIHQTLNHYRGRIVAWNVVNEALSDEEGKYLRDTAALRSIGPDYVARAFEFAQEADPEVELYYNDYNIEEPIKRAKVVRLLRELKAEGLRIDAVGMQGHWMPSYPELVHISEAIEAYVSEGVKVLVTELDVDVLPRTFSGANMATVEHGPDPYPDELPEAAQEELADRYYEIFSTLAKHPEVESVTFWGSHDGRSWLNDFPVVGRTNHPLLFDRELRRKLAFFAAVEALQEAAARKVDSDEEALEAEPTVP